jgi:L-alanine-DL-glutamate epimerase-like enolase superfamily enzyme
MTATNASIDDLEASAFTLPTGEPESDGTFEWDRTTAVVVEARSGDHVGLGYSYTSAGAAGVAAELLRDAVLGRDVMDVPGAWAAMSGAVRNVGRSGVAASAIAAVDVALWDLKARVLGVALTDLVGRVRPSIPAYGSGGFTSYSEQQLHDQLAGWASDGMRMVKMKIGRDADLDPERVAVARKAIGPDVRLFVDANGAYRRKEALALAALFADLDVEWFEEPVSSDDLTGLRLIRDRAPAGMDIAAGEYCSDAFAFRRMLDAGAVDVLQVDATRCGGVSGFLRAATLCEATPLPLSAHTAPTLHAHLCTCVAPAIHAEYFHDHARIEQLLFDGALAPDNGELAPAVDRPGLGLELRRADAAPYCVWSSR